MPDARTLSELRAEFDRSPLLAMPIAGTIAWAAVGIFGAILPIGAASLALFFCTGAIFPLGVLIGRFTGEDLLGGKELSELDRLFLMSIGMASLTWGIAIPFWLIEPSSLPLSVGILAGAMWLPLSWMIQHWVGMFHAITRTVLIVTAWFAFPRQRFVVIPMIIVAVYAVSIYVLATRRRLQPSHSVV